MTNVFDDEDGTYFVLRNDAGECSLWPSRLDVPAGWQTVLGPDSRSACLACIERGHSAAAAPSTIR
jgi:MbtH protein